MKLDSIGMFTFSATPIRLLRMALILYTIIF